MALPIIDDELGTIRKFVAEVLLKLLAFLGLAFSGGAAAAAADIELLRQASLESDPVQPIPPAELALGRLRNVKPPFDYDAEAKRSGVDSGRLAFMEDITGEPPGLQELLELYRRQKIDAATLERGIRQSRVRDEWIAAVEALQFAPPGGAEVLAGWVQDHLSDADARQKLIEAGLDPKDHGWLYETHGRPPGVQEMIGLLNRGLMSEADVTQAIRESDIKNKYIAAILATRVYIPPVRSIATLLHGGAIDDARAAELYAENGVRPEDIAAYLAAANHVKTKTQKELSVTEIRELYEDGAITQSEAGDALKGLGYNDGNVALVLSLGDLRRWRKFYEAAIGRVHNLYVNHKITDQDAQTGLDALHVAPEQKSLLLDLWGTERASNVRTLSEAQITKAVHVGLLTPDEGVTRLRQLGYSEADANVLVAETMA